MKDLLAFGRLTIKSHIRIVFVFMHITKWETKLDLYLPGKEEPSKASHGLMVRMSDSNFTVISTRGHSRLTQFKHTEHADLQCV